LTHPVGLRYCQCSENSALSAFGMSVSGLRERIMSAPVRVTATA
jgi:hypothetical protein